MKRGVLLFAFGGPRSREEVRPFILDVLTGRPVADGLVEEVVRRYDQIGGFSPLVGALLELTGVFQGALEDAGLSPAVRAGVCHGAPSVTEALASMSAAGVKKVTVIPLVPQRGAATMARYIGALDSSRRKLGRRAPAVVVTPGFPDHALFIDALSARVRAALAGLPEQVRSGTSWVFCAHSVPSGAPGVQTYLDDVTATARALAGRFGNHAWKLSFQSRGSGREAWLGPRLSDTIQREAERGAPAVMAVPVSFVLDNLEVLYDLDIEARRCASQAGVAFTRAGVVGTHPAFVRMLAALAAETR